MTEKQTSSVTPWDPFSDLELPRWGRFGDWPAFRSLLAENRGVWAPALDVAENDDHFIITVELAGAKKEDVAVEANDDVLTIRGEKRSERIEENEQRRHVERSFGSFSRSFTLPANADPDAIKANFADGVLTVEVAKREEPKPKTIAVK